jgi:Fe-S cluster assembly protein SufD
MLLTLPSTRDEAWRWSDLSALPALAAEAIPAGTYRDLPDLPWLDSAAEGPRLLFVDGKLDEAQSRIGALRIGQIAIDPRGHPLAAQVGPEGWALKLGRDHAPAGLVEIVHISTGGANHLPASIELDV